MQEKQQHKLYIPTSNTIEILTMDQILYIEAYENYTKVFLTDGTCHLTTIPFGQLNADVLDYHFFQCHKSYSINMDKMVRYHKTGQVEMANGSMVSVARRRREEFLYVLKEWCETESRYRA